MAKERYVSYLGCKFKVLEEMKDNTTVLQNMAVKLKKEPIRVQNKYISEWVEPMTYPPKRMVGGVY